MYQLAGFGQVYSLAMMQHLLTSYRVIYEIDLKENAVKVMGPYDPAEPLSRLTKKLKKGRGFTRAGGKNIANAMMVSKGITLLEHMEIFNDYIREQRRQTTDLNTWSTLKTFSH